MSTRGFPCLLLLALLLASANRSVGENPPKDAKAEARAAIYQAETRTVYSGRGWRIARDKPSVLILEHNIGVAGVPGRNVADFLDTGMTTGVAQVIFTFKPESAVDTSCAVDARIYLRSKEGMHIVTESELNPLTKDTPLYGPYPMKSEEMLQTIKDLLGKARARLIKDHPEFAAK